MIDYLSSAVIQLSENLAILHINPAAEILLETSNSKAKKLPISHLLILPDSHESLEQLIRISQKKNQPYTIREAIFRTGHSEKIIDMSIIPISGDDGNQILIEIQPIERLHHIAKAELLNGQHQIARKIVRGVAHEIKNPLAGIRGATQLLERTLTSNSHKEITQVIINEVDRLKRIVDGMLGSQGIFKPVPINIHEPLDHVYQLMMANPLVPHKKIERDFDLSLPDMTADHDQMVQVFLNIAVNALEALSESPQAVDSNWIPTFTMRTRIHRMVTIQGQMYRRVLQIDLIDNGPGIPPDLLPHIFYPMMTGRAHGSGLGLSIAQDIVHRHGGLITCDSTSGHTEFNILMPWGKT